MGVTMRSAAWLAATVVLFAGQEPVRAQESTDEDVSEARIWLDRGDEPVVQRGERVRVYYRTSQDSYVAIFRIDTDGSVNLIQPSAPDEDHYIRGGRDYRLLFPRSPYWNVDEDPGVGYYFVVASPTPFDFSSFDYAPYERGWDLSQVGRAVYDDPYLAMDDYVAALIPEWEYVAYTLDFLSYSVGSTHEYPRFMCYQCHGFRSYAEWNPYDYSCTQFRVVIWDDPYFYPSYRYDGTRVVYTVPLRARPRFGFTARYAGEPWGAVVRHREAPPATPARYKEAPERRSAVTPSIERRTKPSEQLRQGAERRPARASVPGSRPFERERPTAQPAPSTRTSPSSTGKARPVLQRRPSGQSGGGVTGRPPAVNRGTGSRSPSGLPSRIVTPPSGQTRPPSAAPRPSTSRSPAVRPNTGSSRPPAVRPNTGSSRPPTVRPPSGGSTSRPRPAVRPRGGGGSTGGARPPVRRGGGGG
jgi:hypothetical protein